MRTKPIAIFTLFAIAALVILLLLRPQTNKQSAAADTNQVNSTVETGNVSEQPLQSATPEGTAPKISMLPADIAQRQKQREQATEGSQAEWKTPIEFYGKVVDENGNAISGAQIDFTCNDVSEKGTSNYHAMSDAVGLFSLKNVKGKLLVAHVSKEGYYTSKNDNDSFEYGDRYGHFIPDSNNPIIFHLRKKGKAEPLVATDFPGFAHIAQLPRDGTPIELDLAKGEKVTVGSGQFKLEFWREDIEKNTRVFNWRCRLSVPSGGLIGTDEEFNFQAPENGYQPFIQVEMPATNQNWHSEIRSKYYILLADGKFGRIDFNLLARNGAFTIQSAINPNGSRNLEPN